MAKISKTNANYYGGVVWRSVDSMILVAMIGVCLSFVAIFSVPMGLRSQNGYEGAEEAMTGLGFRVFVILDAVAFFSSLGVVTILIGMQAKDIVDINMLAMCGRVVCVATGCACLGFMAAASAFVTYPW